MERFAASTSPKLASLEQSPETALRVRCFTMVDALKSNPFHSSVMMRMAAQIEMTVLPIPGASDRTISRGISPRTWEQT
eukprot:2555438-Pleurochrysis_carterae.AAC.3